MGTFSAGGAGRFARWMAGCAGVLLAGCVALAPGYQLPAVGLPGAYALDEQVDGADARGLSWCGYFTDAGLQGAIRQALAHNHDLRAALLRVEEARAAHGIQQGERWPLLAAEFDATRASVPADLNLSRRRLLGNQFQLGVGFNAWELDFWGRVRNLNAAALENYLATEAAARAVRLSVIAQTADAYLSLGELDERIGLARRTAQSRAESLRIFRRREALGAASRLELAQAEALWQQASALLAQLEQARAAQAHALNLLLGGASLLPQADTARPDPPGELAPLQAGLPSRLLAARPDVMAAEHALRAAHANIGAARAAFFPRIALTAAYGTGSAELEGLFRDGSALWSFAPTISLPIFDGGRRQAALDLAQVRREAAVVRYEQVVQQAFREVADALSARAWLVEQARTLDAMQATQRERARLARLRYDSGATRYLEVLDAERDLLAVAQQRVQARRAVRSAQVALYVALGGGADAAGRCEP